MLTDHFITEIFCVVDDELKFINPEQPRRKRGSKPQLCDSEVITMEVVGEFLGMDTDKAIWGYFLSHWKSLFPRLGSRSSFVRQAANLWFYKQELQKRFSRKLAAEQDSIHIVDGLPMTVCNFKRAPRRKVFIGEADLGRCETKGNVYCGFKGHVFIDGRGVITDFTLTPASIDERKAAWDFVDTFKGRWIGDKGYTGKTNKELLKEQGIELLCGNRKNMKEQLPKQLDYVINRVRKIVETVIGQLSERLHIERVRAKDLWHLTSRIARKLLTHTLGNWLNYRLNRPLLQFDGLITQ